MRRVLLADGHEIPAKPDLDAPRQRRRRQIGLLDRDLLQVRDPEEHVAAKVRIDGRLKRDFHLANVVVHALTGRARGTDAEMLVLLAPWAGQRARIVRLVELAGVSAPAFGPRFAPTDIRAI